MYWTTEQVQSEESAAHKVKKPDTAVAPDGRPCCTEYFMEVLTLVCVKLVNVNTAITLNSSRELRNLQRAILHHNDTQISAPMHCQIKGDKHSRLYSQVSEINCIVEWITSIRNRVKYLKTNVIVKIYVLK